MGPGSLTLNGYHCMDTYIHHTSHPKSLLTISISLFHSCFCCYSLSRCEYPACIMNTLNPLTLTPPHTPPPLPKSLYTPFNILYPLLSIYSRITLSLVWLTEPLSYNLTMIPVSDSVDFNPSLNLCQWLIGVVLLPWVTSPFCIQFQLIRCVLP